MIFDNSLEYYKTWRVKCGDIIRLNPEHIFNKEDVDDGVFPRSVFDETFVVVSVETRASACLLEIAGTYNIARAFGQKFVLSRFLPIEQSDYNPNQQADTEEDI